MSTFLSDPNPESFLALVSAHVSYDTLFYLCLSLAALSGLLFLSLMTSFVAYFKLSAKYALDLSLLPFLDASNNSSFPGAHPPNVSPLTQLRRRIAALMATPAAENITAASSGRVEETTGEDEQLNTINAILSPPHPPHARLGSPSESGSPSELNEPMIRDLLLSSPTNLFPPISFSLAAPTSSSPDLPLPPYPNANSSPPLSPFSFISPILSNPRNFLRDSSQS